MENKIGSHEFKVNSFSVGVDFVTGHADSGQVVLKASEEAIDELHKLLTQAYNDYIQKIIDERKK
jgi:hypothetical protein